MGKRLIVILTLAFVVGLSFAAYAEVQNVKVGGELTTLAIDRHQFNLGLGRKNASCLAMIAKVKFDADLTDAVALTMALRNERIWGSNSRSSTTVSGTTYYTGDDDIDLASAYVTLNKFLNDKVTLKIGKMPVHLGSGLLVGDPDTNQVSSGAFNPGFGDLSSRKSFTGGLAVLDLSPLTLTLAGLKVTEGTIGLKTDDVNAYVANAAYDTGVKNTVVEVYDVLKEAQKAEVNNIGGRVVSVPMENLVTTGEFVYQTQKGIRSDKKKHSSDTGLLLTADYALPKVKYTPSLGVLYLRVSDNWNSMFEDLVGADIINAMLPLTDCQLIGVNASAKPMEDVTLKLTYANANLLTALPLLSGWSADSTSPTAFTMTGKKALGNEVDLKLLYDYTEDVQLGLTAGWFNPGAAFDKVNRKAASQVIGSMKVTF